MSTREPFGFIITRHMNSEMSSQYWIECYRCIRQFYREPILIVDDNSHPQFLNYNENDYENCRVVSSEYPQRGELLGYYYFYKERPFEKAVIMHDSVFIRKYIDFHQMSGVKFLWDFRHDWDNVNSEVAILCKLGLEKPLIRELLQFYLDESLWTGCYGVQSVMEYSFLQEIVEKYRFFELLHMIREREERKHLERVFAVLCCFYKRDLRSDPCFFGNIHDYTCWITKWRFEYDYTYEYYLCDKVHTDQIEDGPIIKIWTGR
jgi:hypothetical protein